VGQAEAVTEKEEERVRVEAGGGGDGVSGEEGIGTKASGSMDASRVKIKDGGKGVGT
jgi:hypothetical protein